MAPIVDEQHPRRHRRAEPARRRWFRRPLLVAVSGLFILIVAGVLITWAIAANSWYIAASEGKATLFHGLSSRPLGISLSNVSERGLDLTELTQVDLSRVNAGIDAGSHAQGKCTLDRLTYDSQADAWLKQQKAQPTPKANQNAQPTPPRSRPSPARMSTRQRWSRRRTPSRRRPAPRPRRARAPQLASARVPGRPPASPRPHRCRRPASSDHRDLRSRPAQTPGNGAVPAAFRRHRRDGGAVGCRHRARQSPHRARRLPRRRLPGRLPAGALRRTQARARRRSAAAADHGAAERARARR